MMKKFLSVILAMALVVSLTACGKDEKVNEENLSSEINDVQEQINEIAEDSANVEVGEYVMPSEDSFNWEEVDGGVAIIGYSGDETTIEIPSQIDGKDVVDIKSGTFADVAVVGVKLPDTMTEIGESAFSYCTSLKEVKFGVNIQKAQKSAFEGCFSLQYITLNDSLRVIGERAFGNCAALETIMLPQGLNEIGLGAFCLSGLKSVNIPSSVEKIGNHAFSTCQYLENVVVEDGVKKIGEKAFDACFVLERIEIPASVNEIGLSALAQCPETMVVSAPAGSVAEKYAKEEELAFEAL